MEIAKIQNNIVQPPHENQKKIEREKVELKKTGTDFIDSTDSYPLQDREIVCTIRVIRA